MFDSILAEIKGKVHIVEDTKLKEHWWRNITFLSLVGNAIQVANYA